MSISLTRIAARTALVCLATAVSLGTVFVSRAAAGTAGGSSAPSVRTTELVTAKPDAKTRSHYASSPVKLRIDHERRDLLAYPPSAIAASRPMTVVYLHGLHGRPENGCPWFRGGASELGWLVCPEGAVHDANGTASWGGDVFEQSKVVSRALRAAHERGASTEPASPWAFRKAAMSRSIS